MPKMVTLSVQLQEKRWEGNFIQRSGLFHYLKEPIECKAFRGFKYIEI